MQRGRIEKLGDAAGIHSARVLHCRKVRDELSHPQLLGNGAALGGDQDAGGGTPPGRRRYTTPFGAQLLFSGYCGREDNRDRERFMNIELTQPEHMLLVTILEERQREFLHEISRADNHSFRRSLQERKACWKCCCGNWVRAREAT